MRHLRVRLRAGGIHLAVSALIAIAAMALVFLVWYPGALARAQGVNLLVLVLISVDVALGPLITTLIFDLEKSWKLLRLDLSIVGAVQLGALVYGMHAIAQGRPAYLVFVVDRFEVVGAGQVDPASLGRARTAGAAGLSWMGPKTVAARLPDDQEIRNAVLLSSVSGGPDLSQLPEWYVPFETEKDMVLARLRPLVELRKLNDMSEASWRNFLAEFGGDEQALGYLPMSAKSKDGAVIVGARTGKILGVRLLLPSWGERPIAPGEQPIHPAPGLG